MSTSEIVTRSGAVAMHKADEILARCRRPSGAAKANDLAAIWELISRPERLDRERLERLQHARRVALREQEGSG